MKMKRINSSLHIPKGTVRDPPKGTHKEFATTMKASTSKVSKGKAIKCSISGIGSPTSLNIEYLRYLRHQPALCITVLKDALL